jgi:hypothetical protein
MAAEDLETSFDSFERKEYKKGDTLCSKGELLKYISILRSGELAAGSDSGTWLPELGGFAFLGVDKDGLQVKPSSSHTVKAFTYSGFPRLQPPQ